MDFPTHWIRETYSTLDPRRGQRVTRSAYGWSTDSDAAARQMAIARAKRAVDFVLRGGAARDAYGYGVDPAREELIDTLYHDDQPIAALTRNRYGALVLNTQRVLFADIDRPAIKPTGGFLSRLFGKSPAPAPAVPMLDRLRAWQAGHPSHALRLYETAAGYRVIFVERQYGPTDERSLGLLRSLGADPLYIALCKRQGCFRARLTPKPWRCGLHVPGITFPYAAPSHETAQRQWEAQ